MVSSLLGQYWFQPTLIDLTLKSAKIGSQSKGAKVTLFSPFFRYDSLCNGVKVDVTH